MSLQPLNVVSGLRGAPTLSATEPKVVAVGGGHGLAATLRATRTYAGLITAVVTVADDGGSTGRLRAAGDRPAPGDLRTCLVALADESSPLARAMDYRFVAGELDGHAFGNLLIVALEETQGDLVAALDQVGQLLGAVGRVLPATREAVTLRAAIRSGDVVQGEQAVGSQSDVSRVSLFPAEAKASPEAVQAILEADQILLGPGSLYTSVLAATAVSGIAQALQQATGQFVYVCNLNPQVPETVGYSVADHVRALKRHGLSPDVVLYHADWHSSDSLGPSAADHGADTEDNTRRELGELCDARFVSAVLASQSGTAHDPALLGEALARLAADARMSSSPASSS